MRLTRELPPAPADGAAATAGQGGRIGERALLCRDDDGMTVAVEIKCRGAIDGVEQFTRYLDLLNRDPQLAPVSGVFAAQQIKPQAHTLATDRAG